MKIGNVHPLQIIFDQQSNIRNTSDFRQENSSRSCSPSLPHTISSSPFILRLSPKRREGQRRPLGENWVSIVSHAAAGDEHVERRVFANVADRLLVGNHREVVAVALQYLVVDLEAGRRRRAALVHLRHVDALVESVVPVCNSEAFNFD